MKKTAMVLAVCVLFCGRVLGGVVSAKLAGEEWQKVRQEHLSELPAEMASEPSGQSLSEESLNIEGRMPLSAAAGWIARVMGRVLVLAPEVKDMDIDVSVYEAPAERALRRLLYPLGLGYRLSAHELVVLERDTRVFYLSLPPVTQNSRGVTSNESRSGSGKSGDVSGAVAGSDVRVGAGIVLEQLSRELSFWEDAEKGIRSLLGPGGTVSMNRVAGLAVVSDRVAVLERVERLVEKLNERAGRQIFVDVRLVEVELSKDHRLGIDWEALMERGDLKPFRAASTLAADQFPSSGVLTLTAAVDQAGSGGTENGVNVLLRALDSYGKVEVVSQPRLALLNNTLAGIQVGETRSYIDSSGIESTQNGGTITAVTLGQVHGGVTLQLLGNLEGEELFLNVTPVVSQIDEIRSIPLGGGARVEAPETSVKSLSSMVRLKDGQTAVIGGLITRHAARLHTGIPWLGRLPVAGRLFSYESRREARSELVAMITFHRRNP